MPVKVTTQVLLGWRLLLDSRVVDVPLVYHLAFAMLSSLKLLFFKSLKNASLNF